MRLDEQLIDTGGVSRRQILSAGTAAALTGLAGCSASDIGDAAGDLSGGGGGSLDYTQWAYAPDVLDKEHYFTIAVDPTTIVEAEDEFEDEAFDEAEGIEDQFTAAIDFDEMESLAVVDSNIIFTTSEFEDTDEFLDEADDEGDLGDDEEIEDWTVAYDDDDEKNRGAAYNGNTVLITRQDLEGTENDAEDVLEALIESKAGEEDRYTDESEHFNLLTEQLGEATVVFGRTHEEYEDRPTVDLQSGDTINRVLTQTGQEYNDRLPYETLTFYGSPNQRVDIEMSSSEGNFLVLNSPDGNELQVESGYSGTDANIQERLNQEGVYEIYAGSLEESVDQGMNYELSFDLSGGESSSTPRLGLEAETARGTAISIDGDEATRDWVFVYADESDVDTDELEGQFEDAQDESDALDEYDGIEVSQDGRTATISATVDTDSITSLFTIVPNQ